MDLLSLAGVEGYEMKSKILKSFDDIRATQARIEREKAKERAAARGKGKK